ncbi:hypothetical protein EDD11_006663 [Mortierella claussenii]|nr:hypothetical protein EDD11_006663 [Mortierella claussenii]
MPKVKANKSRVHHKAVGNKEVAAAAANAPGTKTNAESMQHMKEQFGLEFEEDRIDKKDKRKLRHDKWMSTGDTINATAAGDQLEATYNPQKKKKNSPAQNQTLSVDFGSFHDVLSTIDPTKTQTTSSTSSSTSAFSSSATASKLKATAVPGTGAQNLAINHQQYTIHSDSSKPLQSKKAKKKAAMQEILRFQNVLAHPAFKSNPLLTIQQHVKNTMEMAPSEPVASTAGGMELMED